MQHANDIDMADSNSNTILIQNQVHKSQYQIFDCVGYAWNAAPSDCQFILEQKVKAQQRSSFYFIYTFQRKFLPVSLVKDWSSYQQVFLNNNQNNQQALPIFLNLLSTNYHWVDFNTQLGPYKRLTKGKDGVSPKKILVTKLLELAHNLQCYEFIRVCLSWFNCTFPNEEFILPQDCTFLTEQEEVPSAWNLSAPFKNHVEYLREL